MAALFSARVGMKLLRCYSVPKIEFDEQSFLCQTSRVFRIRLTVFQTHSQGPPGLWDVVDIVPDLPGYC
jgi:hypothetical protein